MTRSLSADRWRVPIAVVAAALLVASCSSTGATPSPSTTTSEAPATAAPATSNGPSAYASLKANSNYKITLIVGQNNDPFFVTMAAGATAEAKRLGVTLDWQGPANYDPTGQIPIVDAVLAAKPQFLVIAPTDGTALIAPIKQFGSAGIPVLTVDSDVSDATVRIGNITSNNVYGGQVGAETIAKLVNNTGNVFLLCDPPGTTTTTDRSKGFEATIKTFSGVTYVGRQNYNATDASDAARVMNAELAAQPNLAGVFACDGNAGLGAATAIKSAGKSGQIKIVSFDVGPDLVVQLKGGTISGLIIQRSTDIGALSVDYAVSYLNGDHNIPPQTLMTTIVGTAANIDSPEVAKYIYGS